MAAQDVLDDGEPEAGAALAPSAAAPRPGRSARSAAADARGAIPGPWSVTAIRTQGRPAAGAAVGGRRVDGAALDLHRAALAAILDRVVDQVDEQLMQLVRVAR